MMGGNWTFNIILLLMAGVTPLVTTQMYAPVAQRFTSNKVRTSPETTVVSFSVEKTRLVFKVKSLI